EETEKARILAGIFEDERLVNGALDYLVNRNLVISNGSGRYELAHDFLAEFFSEKSGAELHPIERDNIFVAIAAPDQGGGEVLIAHQRTKLKRRRLGRVVLGLLLAVMGVRFLYFGLDTTVVGPSVSHPVSGNLFDVSYAIILIPYAVWVAYVATFYDRVFIYLKESGWDRVLSVFVLMNLAIAVCIGILVPIGWIFGLTIGGVAFGLKLIMLARRPELNISARRRLRQFGTVTLFNLGVAAVLGIAAIYFSVSVVSTEADVETWIWANLFASLLVTYWCLALVPTPISRSGVSQLLGLMGRPGPLVKAHAP
ncbi:MAG TPA: hypothetical protein VFV02_06065, partial [Acidimicrobiales bacterium]|nr:hypothetical protein [Acidimicrobiales bacterium]